ncbi:formin-like protein 3 [Trifolium pratense]|uniref:formin-like protein 3 n=1 Tax=Trifolium pratense TaxID=57577 RepID=UPI001E6928BC|nr:formin-like protein 3 [Trifolium pratense]
MNLLKGTRQMTKPSYLVVYVILLCALAKGGSEGKRWKNEDFYRYYLGIKAEQMWKHCRNEMIERNYDIEFDLHLLDEMGEKRSKFLPPNVKQHFLDCILNRNFPIPASEQEGYSLKKHYESLFGLSDGHRYFLSELQHNQTPPSPDSVPSSGSSPKPKGQVAAQVNLTPPAPGLPYDDFLLTPPFAPPPPSRATLDDEKQRKSIIIAGVASGIIILIGLFLCYREVKKRKIFARDDRPLLILSDFSGGSSQKSTAFENSDMREHGINYGTNPSTVRNLPIKHEVNNGSLNEITLSDDKGQVPVSQLQHPPGRSAPEAPPTPPPPPPALAPQPRTRTPPPPKMSQAPPAPPKPMAGRNQKSPLGPHRRTSDDSDAPKPKLKPFFWDKVSANPDQAMVWHEIRAGSFQFSEEKIESLFGCPNQNRNERRKDAPSLEPSVQYIKILEPKKAQNLSILLRALNVSTTEVTDALNEGNEIPVELIQTVLKMWPTMDEESKLKLYTGDVSQLGPAERFLKALVDIPLAFKRFESLLFMFTLPEEASNIKECFTTLEISCNELRKSRLFQKLLEAVLKTGNRLNDGTYRGGAQAFKLDTLLKLADVKGTDGKTTLLHFVVQEIIRSEGIRAVRTEKESPSHSSMKTEDSIDDSNRQSEEHYRSLGLQVVSGLSTELEDVKKAALIDGDALTAAVLKLDHRLAKTEDLLNNDLKNLEEESEFQYSLADFVEKSKEEVKWLTGEEKRIMAEVKNTADYFHGNAGKDEGLRLFVIVRDFLLMLDKVCKEVKVSTKTVAIKDLSSCKKEASSMSSSPDTQQPSPSDMHRRLFPAIAERRMHDSSSDDDDDDNERLPT